MVSLSPSHKKHKSPHRLRLVLRIVQYQPRCKGHREVATTTVDLLKARQGKSPTQGFLQPSLLCTFLTYGYRLVRGAR